MKRAPWTEAEVNRFNDYQNLNIFHPYTCGEPSCRAVLLATVNGWICQECGYQQDWINEDIEHHLDVAKVVELEQAIAAALSKFNLQKGGFS